MPEDKITAQKSGFFIRPLKIKSMGGLFKSLVGMVTHSAGAATTPYDPGQWGGMAASFAEFVDALGFRDEKEAAAWKLLGKAMGKALYDLVGENRQIFTKADEKELQNATHTILQDGEFSIDADFFDRPGNSAFIGQAQDIFRSWMSAANVPEAATESLTLRLPSFFVYALHNEWRTNKQYYQQLQDYFDSPFFKAKQYAQAWERYNAWLELQADAPVFDAAFSLRQIYVLLNAYYEKSEDSSRYSKNRIVVDLEKHLEEWLHRGDKNDAIRVICGGPGCGKSTFTKLFAARLAPKRKLLFVPLHLLSLKDDLGDAIQQYLNQGGFFDESPYEKEDNLLLIFDGLDELAQQGKACAEIARQFIEEIERHVLSCNHQRRRLQVILTGRELVVQTNEGLFRKPGQILTILPYFVSESCAYIDDESLLKQDKRDIWWCKYGKAIGKGYSTLPDGLRGDKLDELTAQPLLNYLIALTYERNAISFSEGTTRNEVYQDLMRSVFQRVHESHGYGPTGKLQEKDFFEILEEIAVCAWREAGRITTVSAIQKRCSESGMTRILEDFAESAKAGVTNLLTAFYFRQANIDREGNRTFEFTHKSFSEYLLARRFVRQLELTTECLEDWKQTHAKGWNTEECLKHWGRLNGPSALDPYLFAFLCSEIELEAKKDRIKVEKWQNTLIECINHMLRKGIPMEVLPKESFKEADRYARNNEEALLACLSACARVTRQISKIEWPDGVAAGNWICRLRGQRTTGSEFSCSCLNHLVLTGGNFVLTDLYGANLENTDLSEANLSGANLEIANLSRANLSGAYLRDADLKGADLSGADLSRANLRGANLSEANLSEADLRGANLPGADLSNAHLPGADLSNANLSGADLAGANLARADLSGADLARADLSGADLRGAILERANLKGAKMPTPAANLKRVFLSKI